MAHVSSLRHYEAVRANLAREFTLAQRGGAAAALLAAWERQTQASGAARPQAGPWPVA
jgi:hypothetical protein